ncbi:hypothetical protein VU04_11980 [Desulfobulbus sp. TB]|nr:hypothetical protein [Desulfobulbus sp. TB]
MVLTIPLNSMFGQWPCYGIFVHHRRQRLKSIKGKFLTVTFLGEQADWGIKAEISRARNQQVILMPPFQMTFKASLPVGLT